MTGQKFLHGLITPIDPKNIFSMIQAGYAADFILALTVESLNGVRNRSTALSGMREADPDFMRALGLLREAQLAGGVGVRVDEDKSKGTTAVLFFRRDDLSPETAAQLAELRRLLKLAPDQQSFLLTHSPVRGADNELAVNSRSMIQIMSAFSSYMDVPEEHLQDHSAVRAFESSTAQDGGGRVHIYSGKARPTDAFAAVAYRGHWYWINEGDWPSKRALTAIMFFFTLGETSGDEKLPVLTIPAQ